MIDAYILIQIQKRYCFPSTFSILNSALKIQKLSLLLKFRSLSSHYFSEKSSNSFAILSKASLINGRGEGVQIR